MDYKDDTFDGVIDKGLLDSLLVGFYFVLIRIVWAELNRKLKTNACQDLQHPCTRWSIHMH